MSALLSSYPLRATKDCRSAVVAALRKHLEGLSFSFPRTSRPFRFNAVYDKWATFNDRAQSSGGKLPAAAVLPDRPTYDASGLTPAMLEETWSGGDPGAFKPDGSRRWPLGDGTGDGYALFRIAEMVVPLVVLVRAVNEPSRSAIVAALEASFVEDGSLMDPSQLDPVAPLPNLTEPQRPVRYGLLLDMPSYFGRKVRFTLQAQQLLDSETTAMSNRWMAQFELQGHAQVCVVRRVRAMNPRVQTVVDLELDRRG